MSDVLNLGICSAVFSSCRTYRYELWREWSDGPYCMFVGLNPSTADETQDDPTIRRCIGYARKWGYGALCMTNLFAFRATDPKVMMATEYPIGPDNDEALVSCARDAGIIIAAWGKHGMFRRRSEQVLTALLPEVHCLKQNKDGSPAHPLYLRIDMIPYPLKKSL